MSASLRFLAIAVIGWAGLRAATLGILPDAEAFTLKDKPAPVAPAGQAAVPAIVPTEFPPIALPGPESVPLQLETRGWPQLVSVSGLAPGAIVPIYHYPASAPPAVRYYSASLPAPRQSQLTPIAPMPAPLFYSPIPQLDEWPLSRIASAAMPARRSATAPPQQSIPPVLAKEHIDRLQLTAWALLRGRPGPSSLASGGTLGSSQAGARLNYHLSREIALSLRTSSPVGGARGGELAMGMRFKPIRSIPVWMTYERRQAIGTGGGRSAFAFFFEGGVYQQPMPLRFTFDAYAQAGMVGVRSPDFFVDGAFTLTRPLFGKFSAGVGVWGGVQPGIYRIDAGPRLSMPVHKNVRVHLDWRQRLAGNAEPASGPALTLAGDF